jgi:AhpC/TSA antioxidant enzyme
VFCREHAVQLHRDREEFDGAGVRLAVIGQETPEEGRKFLRSRKLDLPLLVDTEREAYKAAGAKKATFMELLGPKVVAKGIRRAIERRVYQGRTVGHPALLGGVLLVAPDGSIPYAHLAEDAGDIPPNEEVLAAAKGAAERVDGGSGAATVRGRGVEQSGSSSGS